MDDPQYDLDPYLEGACAHRACGSPTRLKLTCTQFGLRALELAELDGARIHLGAGPHDISACRCA